MQKSTTTLQNITPAILTLRCLAGIAVTKEGVVYLAELGITDLSTVANKSRTIQCMDAVADCTVIKEVHRSSLGHILTKVEGEMNQSAIATIQKISATMMSTGLQSFLAPGMAKSGEANWHLATKHGAFEPMVGIYDAKIDGNELLFVEKNRTQVIMKTTLSMLTTAFDYLTPAKVIKAFTREVIGLGRNHQNFKGIPISLKGTPDVFVIDAHAGTCLQLQDVNRMPNQTFIGMVSLSETLDHYLELFVDAGEMFFYTPSPAVATNP